MANVKKTSGDETRRMDVTGIAAAKPVKPSAGLASSQSSEKVLQVLECMARNNVPCRLQDLAETLHMPQPTLLRYLRALVNTNYVYQEEQTSRYALTWKLCRLGRQIDSHMGLKNIVTPFLETLSRRFNLGACLVVNNDGLSLYLDFFDPPDASVRILQRIGRQAPLHATSSGKLLLSEYSESELDEQIHKAGLLRLTQRTITERGALEAELERVRRQGYAVDDEECEAGIRCVSVPLYDYRDSVAAAISLFGKADVVTHQKIQEELLQPLFETQRVVSLRLGSARFAEQQ